MLTLVLKALIVLVAGLAAMLGNPLIRLLLRRIDHASAPADADAEVDVARVNLGLVEAQRELPGGRWIGILERLTGYVCILTGFTAGIAVVIALQQVPSALGVTDVDGNHVWSIAAEAVRRFVDDPQPAPVVVAFAVVPFVASEYLFAAILIPFVIMSLAALGLNILVGYCGQISLGGAAFGFIAGTAIYWVVDAVFGFRLSADDERQGADISIHKIGANPEDDARMGRI